MGKVRLKEIIAPIIITLSLYCTAVVLFIFTGYLFYLYNFLYIGTAIGVGIFLFAVLPKSKKHIGRKISLFFVGTYMLLFLGFFMFENMQIEGFFFYLFAGSFAGAVIHFSIGKIAGLIIFNRGWCGWACWSAMIFDLLPYSNSKGRIPKLGWIKYAHFLASLSLVLILWFVFRYRYDRTAELYWLIAGNLFYYIAGIGLAFKLKDNRAFCKYLCPITFFLKGLSRLSILKVASDKNCNLCGICEKACPMDIKLREYIKNNKRILSSECIFCNNCINCCPKDALKITVGFDYSAKDLLNKK